MNITIKKSNILIYCSIILTNLYYGLSDTIFQTGILTILLLVSLMLSLLHIFFTNKYQPKKLVFLAILIVIFSYNFYITKDSRILALIITIIAIRDLDLKNVLKVTFFEKLILTVSVAFLSIIMNVNGGRIVLGFSHGNLLMLTFVDLILLYLCIYWEKINMYKLVILLFVILLCFVITGSRTGLITSLLIWLLTIGFKCFQIKKVLNILGKFLPIVLMFLSLYLPLSVRYGLFIGNGVKYREVVDAMDRMLSHRFTLTNLILEHTDIGLISSSTNYKELNVYQYLVVDSGYVQLLLVFGIVGSLIFIILHFAMVQELVRREQYIYIIAVIAMALYAFTENSWCSLKYNFTLFFFVQLLQPDSKYKIMEILPKRKKKILGN